MASVLRGNKKDLGGFSISRFLPNADHPMIGPFIFFDHLGPAEFPPGKGINVRPHPHIGLATITYLFSGSLLHRDSLGNVVEILPGDVNWMTAGKGITHSERQSLESIASHQTNHALQTWIALPEEFAEIEPAFFHIEKNKLPQYLHDDVFMRLIAGDAFGMNAPLKTFSPMFYLDVIAKENRSIPIPETGECGVYIVDGEIIVNSETYSSGTMLLLAPNDSIDTKTSCRIILFGGEAWQKQPTIEWNFVSFSNERLQQAKQDWKNNKFPTIPGDELEQIPLPE